MRIRPRHAAFVCALFIAMPLSHAAARNQAADIRKIEASGGEIGHTPKNAVDGSPDTYWAADGSAASPAWIEMEWDRPVAVQEIAVRRFVEGKPDISRMELYVPEGGTWQKIGTLGGSGGTLPLIAWIRLPTREVQKLRIGGIDGPVRIAEIEIYAERSEPFLEVRSDSKGMALGVLTDAFGSQGIPTRLQISGVAVGKPWRTNADSTKDGEFTFPIPVGLTGPISFDAVLEGRKFHREIESGSLAQGLVPRPSGDHTLSLNNLWKFQCDPADGFEKPGFNDSSWSDIEVPSHWVMKGFTSQTGVAGYRKTLLIPKEWSGRRIRLAFDGVYSEAEVWVNGVRAGAHTGGATGFQLDVTAAAKPGEQNLIALRVRERSKASELDNMSAYADFSLAGIYRKAYLFSIPGVHIARMHSSTRFSSNYQKAELVAEVTVTNETAAAAHRMLAIAVAEANGKAIATSSPVAIDLQPWSRSERRIQLDVENPSLWSSEHPELYTLTASLNESGNATDSAAKRIGFRETRIQGTQILVNGVPVKLNGACHHDSHPLLGRSVTPEVERQDVLLMKEANLNALRTSHYPPIPELLDITDELGMYVEEEASFCWVNNASDLRYGPLVKQLASEMVERDMTHPSVLYWSAGNESDWGPTLFGSEKMIRAADPTRPVMGSWWDHFDMEIHHNPITLDQIQQYESHKMPVLFDESIGIFQGIWDDGKELWRDPGYRDYYVDPLIPIMDAYWNSKTTQGSFIWAWADDLFLVPGRASEYGRSQAESHGVDFIYHQPGRGLVGDAPWGVVDGWRRKKPEFWHIKELHSPIRVTTRQLALPGSRTIRIPVQNRYFFTNLSEVETRWSLNGHSGTVHADVAPQQSGAIEIPIDFAVSEGSKLELKFVDKRGGMVDAAAIQLGEPAAVAAKISGRALIVSDRRDLSDEATIVAGDGFEVAFSRRRGLLRYGMADGETVLYAQPQVWVLPTNDTRTEFPSRLSWRPTSPVDIEATEDQVTVTARGAYPDFAGEYRTTIDRGGNMTVAYVFRYTGTDLRARETGFRFAVPLSQDQLTWKRKGEWSWYPAEHIAALEGSAPAHSGHPTGVVPDWPYRDDDSAMGTNAFRSTKRNILSAAIRNAAGAGVGVQSDGSQHLRTMVESDQIAVHVNDWFGGTNARAGEWTSNYHDGKLLRAGDVISGQLHLKLLGRKTQAAAPEIYANR